MIPAKINYTAYMLLPFAKKWTLSDQSTKAAFNLNGYVAEVIFKNSAHQEILNVAATTNTSGEIAWAITAAQVSQLNADGVAYWELNMTPPSEVKQRYAGGRFDIDY